MSEKITQYLMTNMTRVHSESSRAIDKEIAIWSKRVNRSVSRRLADETGKKKPTKAQDDIASVEKMIEGMIDNLVNK